MGRVNTFRVPPVTRLIPEIRQPVNTHRGALALAGSFVRLAPGVNPPVTSREGREEA